MSNESSLLDFVAVRGVDMETRYGPFAAWIDGRRKADTWPYRRVMDGPVSDRVGLTANGRDAGDTNHINYASQDYLGLAQDSRLAEAAKRAVDAFGVHSAGSPTLLGRSRPMVALAERLCAVTNRERCVLYPTGWAAGYGVIAGLVRREDVILIDRLAHNCLHAGTRVTRHVHHFAHNDLGALERLLRKVRAAKPKQGVFVVVESLYSMDADGPELTRLMALARAYDAIVILDVAHDFGSMGAHGLGILERVAHGQQPDVIIGSFSKTFASNGGFVLCAPVTHEYLCYHSPSHVFSNALSPVQASVVLRAADIVFSAEGARLRQRLMTNVMALRDAMTQRGLTVGGSPSPIVPVFVGEEGTARVVSRSLAERGLLANLVEFPAVARGAARFRFQVMPGHSAAAAETAADIMAAAVVQARGMAQQGTGSG